MLKVLLYYQMSVNESNLGVHPGPLQPQLMLRWRLSGAFSDLSMLLILQANSSNLSLLNILKFG